MKAFIYRIFIAAGLVAVIAACGSGGSIASLGIGGSGFTSSGTVTGFGSVFVNGVEYETDSAVFEIEDSTLSESDLRIGMVVQVEGTINPDGVTGTATRIQYRDDLEGPVTAMTENADQTVKTLTILGKTVIVGSGDTVFDGTTYGSITAGNVLEISGFYDDAGVLQASYVELKSPSSTQVEITGTISGLTGTNFVVQGVNVNAASANLEDLPNGLQENVFVEVKGTFSAGTINATVVEGEDNELNDDGGEVEVEGYITRYVSDSDFDINGYTVNAVGASLTPSNLVLEVGIKVEAEGTVSNGVLNATEVEVRGGSSEVSALVNSVGTNNFTVDVVGYDVTVEVTTATRMEDDLTSNDSFTLAQLIVGQYVEVRGFETGTTTITATQVKRKAAEDTELKGVVTAQDQNVSVTVLGVVFPVDGATTDFEDQFDVDYPGGHADLISAVTLNQSIVEITDVTSGGNALNVADEVELERP